MYDVMLFLDLNDFQLYHKKFFKNITDYIRVWLTTYNFTSQIYNFTVCSHWAV